MKIFGTLIMLGALLALHVTIKASGHAMYAESYQEIADYCSLIILSLLGWLFILTTKRKSAK